MSFPVSGGAESERRLIGPYGIVLEIMSGCMRYASKGDIRNEKATHVFG